MRVKRKTIEGKRAHWVDCPVCGVRLTAIEGYTEGEPITEESFAKSLASHIRREHPGSAEAAKLDAH